MSTTYFDTHFHLEDKDDPASLVAAAEEAAVAYMLAAGAAVGKTQALLDRIAPFPNIYASVGIHPHEAERFDSDIQPYRDWTEQDQVVAIGEIGLDYFYDHSPREQQQQVFCDFLNLAVETKLPAIVHIREAYQDAYDLLKEFAPRWRAAVNSVGRSPFVVHCFSGSPEWATRYLELGGMLSFTGLVTFKKAAEVRESLKVVPTDRVMFETDSPYLAPTPHRGKRNQPAYVVHTVDCAAQVLGLSTKKLADISTQNGLDFFQIPS